MTQNIILIIATALLVPGVAMAFVPMLPALSYMFVIALGYGLIDKFEVLSGKETFWLLLIVAISILIDHTSGLLGAKYGGAHGKSLLWGVLGGFLGTFVLPAVGTFAGLFLSVLAAEIYYGKKPYGALKSAGGALLGSLAGVAANVFLAVGFIAAFLYFVLV